jgi:hypothetical protein
MFEGAVLFIGLFETNGEQRICSMAAQPDRDATFSWRKSSASGGDGACVEVARSGSSVLVRDSRNQSGTVLSFTHAQWRELIGQLRNAGGEDY